MRWFSMSTRTLSDPKVVQLGERHGPVGPLFWTSLLCHAGAQEQKGKVDLSFRAVAFEIFSDAETVNATLDSVIELGLCHTLSRDVHGFKVHLPAWERYQATGRKARQRERDKGLEQADVTDRHTASHDVTTDRQDRHTDKEIGSPSSPSVGREDDLSLTDRVWSILQGGVDGLSENDNGRPWPSPSRGKLALAIGDCDPELAMRVAREVREIVQAQDRAPNISALYEQRLSEVTR